MTPNPRRYWRWTLAGAVAVSVAGNVGHAWLTAPATLRVPAAVAAALPPIALLVVTEGLARAVGAGLRRAAYRVAVTGAAAIAATAFVLSFVALRDLAVALGQPAAVAAGWPLLADAVIAVSSLMLLAMKPADPDAASSDQGDDHLAEPEAAPAEVLAELVAPPTYPTGNAWLTSKNGLAVTVATGEIDVAESEVPARETNLDEAARIIAATGIVAAPEAVAVVLAELAAGSSRRAAATASDLHRTQVTKIAEHLSESAAESAAA